MQRDSDPILGGESVLASRSPAPSPPSGLRRAETASAAQARERAGARGQSLLISPDVRAYICRHRPELATAFEIVGEQASIPVASLLQAGPNELVPSFEFRVPGPINSESGTRNPEPTRGLGDDLAKLLRAIGVQAIVNLLQRRGLLGGCQCANRQARLNSLTPRLLGLLEPGRLTLAVILSWLLFAFVMLVR